MRFYPTLTHPPGPRKVPGSPRQMCGSPVVVSNMCGLPVVLSTCVKHWSSFPNVWVANWKGRLVTHTHFKRTTVSITGRPFLMCGSPVVHFKCVGHRSSFPNVWVTSRPFQMCGSPVVVSKRRRKRTTGTDSEAMGSNRCTHALCMISCNYAWWEEPESY